MAHFKTDDKENYVGRNIDNATQDILITATEAVINGTEIPTFEDKATQVLIDLAVMGAQGGRENEFAGKISEGYAAGLTKDNMLAVPLLTAPYNAFPRTLNMRNALSAAIDAAKTAQETIKTTVTMQIGNPVMTINGSNQNIDAEGTAPVVVDDRTLLPVRAFVESIGGTVDWNENAQTATLKYNGDEIRLTINSATAYLNNEAYTLDVTPVIINDRTMLPIRFIAESFGYTVLWSQDTQTVTIINADTIENIFAKGDLNPSSPHFTGVSYVNRLSEYNDSLKIPAFAQVTLEPCTRTDWHYHDGGQILLVTEGVGVFETEGEAARIMQSGDVILIPPRKVHMHSAINDSHFAHIAIGVNPEIAKTNWLDKVTDEEYNAAVDTARATGTIREKGDTMFPKGEVFSADGYSGNIYRNMLVENESVFNCPEIDYFTLEAGARTAWHSHEGGQLIIVTNGTGIYQEDGQQPRVIKAGDVIEVQPGVNNWHGAADKQFSYIAINGNPGNDKITWGNDVTDEEYNYATAENS
ncbi:MAG: stalk domain-containing protein [Candidatus Ornithomonoglobus sp.]